MYSIKRTELQEIIENLNKNIMSSNNVCQDDEEAKL